MLGPCRSLLTKMKNLYIVWRKWEIIDLWESVIWHGHLQGFFARSMKNTLEWRRKGRGPGLEKNWVTCFRAQFTSTWTRRGIIRDFRMFSLRGLLCWQQHQAGKVHTGRATLSYSHLALYLPSWLLSYPGPVNNSASLTLWTLPTYSYHHPVHSDHDPNQAGKNMWQTGHWGRSHPFLRTSLVQTKCATMGEESQFRTQVKSTSQNFPALLKTFHFSLSPWFRNLPSIIVLQIQVFF